MKSLLIMCGGVAIHGKLPSFRDEGIERKGNATRQSKREEAPRSKAGVEFEVLVLSRRSVDGDEALMLKW